MSQVVADRLQEWFSDANRRRYQHISQTIDAVMGDDETALLLINERHQVQFPSDVEVIYIAPPALDEFRRWVQNWAEQRQAEMSRMADGGGQVEAENSSEDNGDSAPDS
jgi:guanylate kinase